MVNAFRQFCDGQKSSATSHDLKNPKGKVSGNPLISGKNPVGEILFHLGGKSANV